MLASPKGKAIGSIHPGGSVRVLETRGAYAKVSIDGFVERAQLSSQTGRHVAAGGQPIGSRSRSRGVAGA